MTASAWIWLGVSVGSLIALCCAVVKSHAAINKWIIGCFLLVAGFGFLLANELSPLLGAPYVGGIVILIALYLLARAPLKPKSE